MTPKRLDIGQSVVVGDSSQLTLGKSKWKFSEKVSVEVPFTGLFDKCISSRPKRGATLPGFATFGLRVVSSEVIEMDGGAGELVVNLEAELPDDEEWTVNPDEPLGEPVFTIEWLELDVKIESLDMCGIISSTGAQAGITDLADDWEKVAANPDYYQNRGYTGWNSSEYVSLKQEGIESKRVYYPKVSRTLYYFKKPSDLGVMSGKRQTPPTDGGWVAFSNAPTGRPWEWLCGADSATRNGKFFERRTEWIGADKLNTLLYPTSS
jgi:hypothetical protein